MNRRYRHLVLGALVATFTVAARDLRAVTPFAPLAAQERPQPVANADEAVPAIPPSGFAPRLDERDLAVTSYLPRFCDIEALRILGIELFGDNVEVWRAKPARANGEVDVERFNVQQFVPFGRSLLIRTSRANAAAITRALAEFEQRELELAEQEERDLARAAEEGRAAHVVPAAERLTLREVRPRHVALSILQQALHPFERQHAVAPNERRQNFNWLAAANLLLIEESDERHALLADVIARIDRPLPQMRVAALILTSYAPGPGAPAGSLPPDLAAPLAELAPGLSFGVVSTALLHTAIRPDRRCQLTAEGEGVSRWELNFIPAAFDIEHGTLELDDCTFELVGLRHGKESPAESSHSFRTHLTAAIGEWTVVGAVGAQPVFVALRIEPLDSTAGSTPPKASPPGGR